MRIIILVILWILCLGYPSIEVEYSDGLTIRLNGWEKLFRKKKKNE